MRPLLKKCKRENGQANHASTTEEVNGSLLLMMLPMHLIFDILARLPIYAICNCKYVCNTFKNILSDPCFAQLHLAKASRDDYSLVIQDETDPSNIFFTPLHDLDKHTLLLCSKKTDNNDFCDGAYCSWQTFTLPALIPNKTKKSPVLGAYLIGSSNGLLCIRYFVLKDKVTYLCVCNPILGEFTILPRFGELTNHIASFGFCPKTKKYKVLRFLPKYKYCDILTLGTDDDWRRITDAPPPPDRVVDFDSSYKGNLHWIVGSCWSEKSICSFSLETERYSCISLPACFNNIILHPRLTCFEVGTLDGLFCVSFIIVPDQFVAYVMEDYEVKSSWIKRVGIAFNTWYNFTEYDGNVITIRFLDNGVLLLRTATHLVYYDTRKGTTSNIVDGFYCGKLHFLSLVSLKDIVRRENVEQVQRKMSRICSSKASKCRGK